jgi:hypothetical protein
MLQIAETQMTYNLPAGWCVRDVHFKPQAERSLLQENSPSAHFGDHFHLVMLKANADVILTLKRLAETPRQKLQPKRLTRFWITPQLGQHVENGSKAGHDRSRLLGDLLSVSAGFNQRDSHF